MKVLTPCEFLCICKSEIWLHPNRCFSEAERRRVLPFSMTFTQWILAKKEGCIAAKRWQAVKKMAWGETNERGDRKQENNEKSVKRQNFSSRQHTSVYLYYVLELMANSEWENIMLLLYIIINKLQNKQRNGKQTWSLIHFSQTIKHLYIIFIQLKSPF